MRTILLSLLILVLSHAREAAAQDAFLPDRGSWSITASLPNGGGNTAGAWWMAGSRTNLGFEVDFRHVKTEDRANSTQTGVDTDTRDRRFILGPSVKHYISLREPIAAYIRASAALGWQDIELVRVQGDVLERDTADKTRLFRVAIGADWFPFDGVAIGAFTGIVTVWDRVEVQVNNVGSVSQTRTTWNTFKSGIELQYYF